MDGKETSRADRSRLVKVLLGVMALGTLLAGMMIYVFADKLGIEEGTAAVLATIFLVVGFMDYILLRVWDRIYPPK